MSDISKKLISEKKGNDVMDTLFKKAIAGDKRAMASLQVLISNSYKNKKYSLLEDVRQIAYEEYLDKKTPPVFKNWLADLFREFKFKKKTIRKIAHKK